MRIPRTLALVLAGGRGSRMGALTDSRAKPALPVAGTYRLIDVSLSNLVHSHITDVRLVEQYLPHSLNDHLSRGRPWDLDRNQGGLQLVAPFEGGAGEGFAQGNSDTLHRQRHLIEASGADLVLVLSADQLYTLNFLDVIGTHIDRRAELTMVTTTVPEVASRYGVVEVSESGEVTGFQYKPDEPSGHLVSAEIFLYSTDALLDAFDALTADGGRLGDYGEDLVPHLVGRGRTYEHRLTGYWMDLGTLQSYWTAHLQILDGDGATLDDPDWPIYSAQRQLMPARIEGTARIDRSLISPGARIEGRVEHSVIGPRVVVEAGATVTDSVLLDGVRVGTGVELSRCLVDADAEILRPGPRGSDGHLTLIGPDGQVAERAPLDLGSRLPRGFGGD